MPRVVHNSTLLFRKHIAPWLCEGKKVLEVGPQYPVGRSVVFQHCVETKADYHHADVTNRGRVEAGFVPMNGEYIVLCDGGAFDAVVALNVLEHVRQPWVWVVELARVLRVGGLLGIVCPLTWEMHKSPCDCWRVLPDGIEVLMQHAGLKILLTEMESCTDDPRILSHQIGKMAIWDTVGIGERQEHQCR